MKKIKALKNIQTGKIVIAEIYQGNSEFWLVMGDKEIYSKSVYFPLSSKELRNHLNSKPLYIDSKRNRTTPIGLK